jgi:endonuclease-3
VSPKPFDIDQAIERIRAAVAPLPKAAMFELADEGFDSPFDSWSPASSRSGLMMR